MLSDTLTSLKDGDVIFLVEINDSYFTVAITRFNLNNYTCEFLHVVRKFHDAASDNAHDNIYSGILRSLGVIEKEYNDTVADKVDISKIAFSVQNKLLNMIKHFSETKFNQVRKIEMADIISMQYKSIAQFYKIHSGYEILNMEYSNFIVDDVISVKNVCGMIAKSLKAPFSLFFAKSGYMDNLSVHSSDAIMNVVSFIPSICASAAACLKAKTRDAEIKIGENGTLIIDCGKRQTYFSIYKGGRAECVGAVEYGGFNITCDIMRAFEVSESQADKLKLTCGDIHSEESFIVSVDDSDLLSVTRTLRSIDVNRLQDKCLNHLFGLVLAQLNVSKLSKVMEGVLRIKLCGGVANTAGIEQNVKDVFGIHCDVCTPRKIGASIGVKDLDLRAGKDSSMEENASYLSVIGMGYFLLNKHKSESSFVSKNFIENIRIKVSCFLNTFFYS